MKNISRRTAIKGLLAGGAALAVSGNEAMATTLGSSASAPLKGNIRHSVSKWCFGEYPLDEFCEICKGIGIESIELLDPKDWPVVKQHGLTVAMAQGAGLFVEQAEDVGVERAAQAGIGRYCNNCDFTYFSRFGISGFNIIFKF